MTKRKKKRRLKIKNIIIILVVFVLLVGIFWYVLNIPIKNIYVNNNNLVSDDEILKLAGLYNYPSFILSNSKEIEKNIIVNNYIESVDIRKKFGSVVELDVVECKVLAISLDNRVILSNGELVNNLYNYYDVPKFINEIPLDAIKMFVNKFVRVDSNILREISEIEYSPTSVDLERFILYMNDGNIVHVTLTKIEKFNKYNDIKDELNGRNGTIYLDSGNYVELKVM